MTIQLDHTIVPSHHKVASAQRLAELLGVPWEAASVGPFSPVYVNDGLTLDFIDTDEPFPVYHFCFRVTDQEFDAILGRIEAAGIDYRSTVRGPMDRQILERARRPPVGDADGELCAARRGAWLTVPRETYTRPAPAV